MSNQNPTVKSVPDSEKETETVTKESRRQKALNFVKTHKKGTIAVLALGGLVGVSAFTGRKTATVTVQSPLEIEIDDTEDSEDQSA